MSPALSARAGALVAASAKSTARMMRGVGPLTKLKAKCPNCGYPLTWRKETAGEPAHWECREDKDGCGWRWQANFVAFITAQKLRMPDEQRRS